MDKRVELLDSALENCRFGKPVLILEEAVSTNDVLKKRAEAGAPEGFTVVADKQTGGRGRMGRNWLSLEGKGLYMSVLLRPHGWPVAESSAVSMFSALAVARALKLAGLTDVALKWPNDVIVRGGKIAGILVEPGASAGVMDYCVVGIGVNVSHDAQELYSVGATRATSCRIEGLEIGCDKILVGTLKELDKCYERALRGDMNRIIGEWAGYAGRLADIGIES